MKKIKKSPLPKSFKYKKKRQKKIKNGKIRKKKPIILSYKMSKKVNAKTKIEKTVKN